MRPMQATHVTKVDDLLLCGERPFGRQSAAGMGIGSAENLLGNTWPTGFPEPMNLIGRDAVVQAWEALWPPDHERGRG